MFFRNGRTKFLHRDRGQRTFKDRFSLENWANISEEEKLGHSALDCKACVKIDEYGLLKSNQTFISANTPNIPPPQIIIQHIHQHHHTNPVNPTHVPVKVRRQIERDYNKRLREESVKNHTTALYSSNISMNQYAKLRMRQNTEYKKHPVKKHTGKLASYIFDRDVAENYLESISEGSMDLGERMIGKWADMARKTNLTGTKNGEQVSKVKVPILHRQSEYSN